MNQENLLKILPNLYINKTIEFNNNFKNVISINSNIINTKLNILNLTFDKNIYLLNSNNETKIDYNLINNFIFNSYKNNEEIIIICESEIFSGIICVAFIIKYLNLTFSEALVYVFRKICIDVNKIPNNLLKDSFLYYKNINV